jgi:O-antigen ligase
VSERLKHLNQINFSEPLKNNHVSLRERIYYIHYGLEELGDNALIGIGPQNLRSNMQQSLNQQKVISVYPVDHLHNDFLDIILKFGFFSIILLFFIYFYLVKTKNLEHRVLLFLIMIMLASSQITQSHFSHHQAITFFITLFYILQKKNSVPIK